MQRIEQVQAQSPLVLSVLARLGLSETALLSGASTEQLLIALHDSRWEMRASAATALEKKAIPADHLIGALKDEHESVRATVARTLGRRGEPVSVPALTRTLQDISPLVREAAATALGKVKNDSASDSLIIALKDEDQSVRAAAAQALGRLRGSVSPSVFAEALQDASPLVREAAADALGELKDPGARQLLLAHIQDEEAMVRDAIARTLMQLESDSVQNFIQILLQEKRASVQRVARCVVEGLKDLGLSLHQESVSIIPLVIALQGMDKEVEKATAFYLIGRALDALEKRTALSPLIEMLYTNRQEPSVLEGIWRAFLSLIEKALAEYRKIRLLMAAMNDDNAKVRAEARHAVECFINLALTLLGERSSIPHVEGMLRESDDVGTQKTVLYSLLGQALEALGEREPLEPLLARLNSPDSETRADVSKVLAKRAKKALLDRLPPGAVVVSLQNSQEDTPIEVQVGFPKGGGKPKEGRTVIPFHGALLPSKKRVSEPDQWKRHLSSLSAAACPYSR